MLSPATAAANAIAPTTITLSSPAPAYTPAAIRIVSPGAGMPKSSTKTTPPTAQ